MTTPNGPTPDPKKLLPAEDRPLPHKAKKPKPRKVEKRQPRKR
jgi:hypothetical protein